MVSLFLKSLVGALAVLLIALLARSKNFYVAGLVPLFPTFALIAHVIVGSERSAADLRQTALFGLWSLVPYAGYLGVVWFGSTRWSLPVTLAAATGLWIVLALGIIVLWGRVFPPVSG
jgi:membrane protein GlpM